ncbi:hypothetical protein GH714_032930 [Hevea brasiliensis]|uniref:Uncharacterized protein n=1 Tax=Hevea brasiliensis TaxID=3981 RepID=A0A6A6L578_HEVBR|nr:hypothetical protein GH714_032930 [Hevea brasiliensis]
MARPTGGMSGTTTTTAVAMATGTGRPRGRPPKVKPVSVTEMILAAIAALDEKNGSNKTSISKPRGRPPKDPNAPPKPVKPKPATTGSEKPRGRPRKMAQSMEEVNGTATTTIVAMATGTGRPRGRPPKVRPASVTEVSVQY